MINVFFSSCYIGGTGTYRWVDEPEPLTKTYLSSFFGKKNVSKDAVSLAGRCPAIKDYTDNIFVVTSPYDYELSWDGTSIKSSLHNQDFFDNAVIVRDIELGFISFLLPNLVVFAENDSMVVEMIPAYFHDSDFARNTIMIPAHYDAAQHLRKFECSCRFRQKGSIRINRGDALYYLKFHTKEKIRFKRFVFSEELYRLSESLLSLRDRVKGPKPVEFFYNIFKRNNLKKAYLKLIKDNLLT